MKTQCGFTLVELMTSVAVVAITLGIAVPSFNAMIMTNRLATQTNDIIATITYARSEAIKRNRTVTLCRAESAAENDCGDAGPWEQWLVRDPAGNVIRRGSFAEPDDPVSVTSSLPETTLMFSPDGFARTDAGALANGQTILVCVPNAPAENRRQVTLGAGSRISLTKDAGDCP